MKHRGACMQRGCEVCRAIIRKGEESKGFDPAVCTSRDAQYKQLLRACAVEFTPRIYWPERVAGTTESSFIGDTVSLRICRTPFGYSWHLGEQGYLGGLIGVTSTREQVTDAVREELPLLLGRALDSERLRVARTMAVSHRYQDRDYFNYLSRMQEPLGTVSFLLIKAGPAARWLAEEVASVCEAERRATPRKRQAVRYLPSAATRE